MRSTWIAWALWLAMVFGVTNCFGPNLESWRRPSDPVNVSQQVLERRLTTLQKLWLHFRGDEDTPRYFAYANAMLGRPYASWYIRTVDGWKNDELAHPTDRQAIATPEHPLMPWRDFSVEYPPGILPLILLPALVTDNLDTYHRLFCLEMDLLLTAALAFAAGAARLIRANAEADLVRLSLLALLAGGVFGLRRYDAAVALTVSASIYFFAQKKPGAAGAALGLGAAIKFTPLLLAPIFLLAAWRQGGRAIFRGAAAAGAVLAATGAIFAAVAGPHLFDALAYHAHRPVQMESFYAGLLFVAQIFDPHLVSIQINYGSFNAVSRYDAVLSKVAVAALIAMATLVYLWSFRALGAARDQVERLTLLVRACAALLAGFIALNKFASPQYGVWLIPLGALAALDSGPTARVLFLAALALTQLVNFMVGAADSFLVLGVYVLARSLVLLAWALVLLRPPAPAPQVLAEAA